MKTNCCDVVSVETGKIVEVPTVAEFRASLAGADACDIVDAYLLTDGAVHVRDDDITYISQSVAASYGVSTADVRVFVTGSAKLGFSIVEKRTNGGTSLPRYRRFSEISDIDVAVVSPPIFDAIWLELSTHFHGAVFFPPNTERLGDYLVCGWLRPDHFPKRVRLPKVRCVVGHLSTVVCQQSFQNSSRDRRSF